jgi:hypothetical protein
MFKNFELMCDLPSCQNLSEISENFQIISWGKAMDIISRSRLHVISSLRNLLIY